MEMTGAQILIHSMEDEGVEHIWGYPGGAVLPIYDALDTDAKKLSHILVRHEQAAVHAADGYARSTGKPGVVLVTSGPGATNAVTGIATAYMDSIPLICITGQVPTGLIGLDAFQEIDTVGVTRPIVKHNFLVKNVDDLASTLKKAFYLATTGRPGPVVIDIPKDVQTNEDPINAINATARDFKINGAFSLVSFKSRAASKTIIISPIIPKTCKVANRSASGTSSHFSKY